MPAATLTLRELNRATLARQLLLARACMSAVDAVERLFALQAQLARPPFVGLWSRVDGFDRRELRDLISQRLVVRATMLRGTLHLASTRDFAGFRSVFEPLLAGALQMLGDRASGIDPDAVVRTARELLAERPRPFDDLRASLAERGLVGDERAMGFMVRMLLPLVQVPSSAAEWGYDAKAPFALAEAWIGKPVSEPLGIDQMSRALVLRYLAAFGPATPSDAAVWSGLRGLRAVFDELRPELVVFRDERGRELFDLPDAPRPAPDVDAPARFLPEFDNLVLGHGDRSRVLAAEHRPRVVSKNLQVAATFLIDGFVAGTWKTASRRGTTTLALRPFAALPAAAREALEGEGLTLLAFLDPAARTYAVLFEPAS